MNLWKGFSASRAAKEADGALVPTKLVKPQKVPKTPRKSLSYPAKVLKKLLKDRPLETPPTQHLLVVGDSRKLQEVPDNSIHLVVTSPPYPMIELWDDLFTKLGCRTFKEMHEFLAEVWKECYRVLVKGGIACINIGDALRKIKSKFQLFPNHVHITKHCEEIGFSSLPYILWKKPIKRPNAFLGSGFLPPNAYVTLDCEFILLFRKGHARAFPPKDLYRYASHYTKTERDAWFTQIWELPGARQETSQMDRRIAAYPKEIPRRLIQMFSIIGDTVLDPFLGTGTTMKAAMTLNRNSIGYEIDEQLIPTIQQRISQTTHTSKSSRKQTFRIKRRHDTISP